MRPAWAIAVAGAAGACVAAPAADNLVVSEQSPALTLRVARGFRAQPPLRFPIENLTDAERRIFVEADSARRVSRMVVIQFERVQPGSDFRFVYPSTPPRRFGDQVYRSGAFAYDEAAAAAAQPLREAGRTRAFLQGRGYVLPRYWRAGRLARVTDPDGLSEVIIFYLEAADADYAAAPPVLDADGDIVLGAAEREAMLVRLETAVEAVRG